MPGGSGSKESVFNAGDPGSTPGLRRSPGEGNGLENSRDRGAWRATVHGITNSWTQLSNSYVYESLFCTPETNTIS